jgi:phenylalanyl-tRNA synthetase beta chain
MRVPMSWLAEHVEVDLATTALADRLTSAGVEVETIHEIGEGLAGVLAARVLEVAPHPDADRLVLVRIDAGGEDRSVVCGARNFAPGDVVPWAAPGAKLPGGIEIGRRKVRGALSDGMLSSARELGVFDDHSGILILPPDTPVGVDVVEAVGLRDTVLDLEPAPNRGDVLSIRGIAREVALLLGKELKPLDLSVSETEPPADGLASVAVEDAEGCPLYTARVVEGLDATRPSPLWMARRLYLYGQRPLGAVVDVTNYLLLDQGQPLHAFDLDLVPGRRIVVRRAAEGETVRTLDGRDRALTTQDTVITSGEQVLALAGIMGGEDTEVRATTTDVLIESAHFPPATVRGCMDRLGMDTEGGRRWARGVDPASAEAVCDQAAALMARLAGGTVATGRLAAGPGVGGREVIRLDWARSARRLGAPADPQFAAGHLRGAGCRTETADPATLLVLPPTWRFDLERWVDLEEEVARRWGYDHVPVSLPGATGGRLGGHQRLLRRARDVLAGMGLTEVRTDPFLSPAALDRLGLPDGDPRRRTARLGGPSSQEALELRTTLLPGLTEVAGRNLARGLESVAVYELGAVFPLGSTGARERPHPIAEAGGQDLPGGPRMLGVLLAGQRARARFDDPSPPFEFADAKGAVEGLVRALGVPGVSFRAETAPPYHLSRCAKVLLDGLPVGLLGQLHPQAAAVADLPAAAFAVEVELDSLLDAVPGMRLVPAPSVYPELSFDVAFLVPAGVAAGDLEADLHEAAGQLLARLSLFDAYQGPPLPPGHRNLAYRVALQAVDRTLTDADAAAVRDRMAAVAADRLQAVLRTAG